MRSRARSNAADAHASFFLWLTRLPARPPCARSKARTVNYGLMGVFEREFWSNTPGELALVWDFKGEGAHVDPKAKAAAAEAAAKKAAAASRVN